MADTHVTYENIRALLIGLKTKMNGEIEKVDLTPEQKATLEKANKLVNNGDGKSFLADDGTYKSLPVDDIKETEEKIAQVIELFNINTEGDSTTYSIPEIDDAVAKANVIHTDGEGDKILADNGEYITLTVSGDYREMSEEEINTLMGELSEE